MVEVYKNIFMKVFPLTGNPLREINIYIIKTKEGNLIVDTGFNNIECQNNMDDFLNELQIDLKNTSLFLTHLHSDHVGLASYLKNKGLKNIYISRVDGEILKTGISKDGFQWQSIIKNAHEYGMPECLIDLESHPGFINRPKDIFPYIPLDIGDTLDLGEFHFEVIDEAGHTPGMIGLYDRDKEILFCGDHILGKITPNITFWADKFGDSLGTYLKNLKDLKNLPIKYLFSSHRFLISDVNERIDTLLDHHEARLNETLRILRKYPNSSTKDVCKNLHWDIRVKSWDEFPTSQKWFALGETASHLFYLLNRNKVKREKVNGVYYYSIV